MSRKRITQLFPWLLPLRKKQRKLCFYLGMHLDRSHYSSKQIDALLPYQLFETTCPMYNRETGFDMIYQENKVFNLKLAAKPLNNLIICPGETFSFWKTVRYADRDIPYKDGLVVADGKLQTLPGGGLCQMSNLLFWLFLHTPLTIIERHGHMVKDFPDPPSDIPIGVDATVSEGWLDLKVRNDTDRTFQIVISFDETNINGRILTDTLLTANYRITNGKPLYYQKNGKTFEEVDIIQEHISLSDGKCISSKLLYRNCCEIGYRLPDNVEQNNKKRIAVLFGGCSSEYDVSLQSAYAVISHIDREKYILVLIGITRQGAWYHFDGDISEIISDTWHHSVSCVPVTVSPNRSEHALLKYTDNLMDKIPVDAAFPVLHGRNGEDGTVQGLFDLAGIPIVGCGVLASALCMDKDRAHKLVRAAGIAVPLSYVLDKNTNIREALLQADEIGYPLFVKPVKAGSSFGITKVWNRNDLPSAVESAFEYDDKVIIEENIEGFEVGCAVIGNDDLTVGEVDEIELADGFFDFSEKYNRKTSAIHVPAGIDTDTAKQIKQTAQKIYKVLDCRGFARVDMFLSVSGDIVFNEVNTIPGFTANSRFPNMLKAVGMSLEEVISTVIEQALC